MPSSRKKSTTLESRIPAPKYMSFVYDVAKKILDPRTKVHAIDAKNGYLVRR